MNVSCVVSTHQKYGDYFHSTIFPQLSRIFAQLFTTQMTQSLLNYGCMSKREARAFRQPLLVTGPAARDPNVAKISRSACNFVLANQFVKTCALKSGSQHNENTIQKRVEECALASLVRRTRPEGLPHHYYDVLLSDVNCAGGCCGGTVAAADRGSRRSVHRFRECCWRQYHNILHYFPVVQKHLSACLLIMI